MRLRLSLRRFRRNTDGSMLVETVLMLPLLLWAVLALFVYWDAFRAQNTNIKATYTIADMVTRETDEIDASYIQGLNTVFRYLVATQEETNVRVSSVMWSEADQEYKVLWSSGTGGWPALSDGTLSSVEDKLPVMSDGDTVIVLETEQHYRPAFRVGISERTLPEIVVTRPRFARVCFKDVDCGQV